MDPHRPHKDIPLLLTLSKPIQASCTLALAAACYKLRVSKVLFYSCQGSAGISLVMTTPLLN